MTAYPMKMKTQFLWLAIAATISLPVITTQSAQTAIPPLSEQNLQLLSTHIVIGTVTSVQSKEVAVLHGTNYEHTATVRVERVERSRLRKEMPKPEQTINVYYTTLGKRIGGWTGSQKQSRPLEKGSRIKLFLVKDQQGKLQLLEPNGWQSL